MKKDMVLAIALSVGCARVNTFLTPSTACQPLSVFDTLVVSRFDADAAYRHLFKTVLQAPDCPAHAIRIDGKIYSLVHYHRSFRVGIRGRITNCETGESLYKFDSDDESDSQSIDLPRQIAGKLGDGISARLKCLPQ